MHPNPAFRGTPRARNLAFARERGFGVLAVTAEGGPLISHVPFLLAEDGAMLELHLVRSNPIARLKGPQTAVVAVSGPDAYISPDWYGLPDQVPTWNYVAVHLRGTLERRPDDEMHDLLDRQSAEYEARLPKPPWTLDKMTPDARDRMMRQILPFRMAIDSVDGTWKLNQNKDAGARLAAADAVESPPHPDGAAALAALMRDPPET